tara:strand:+ start:6826 stop:7614 length:789 start_codon:yes stop_codon:yes gene_type:complete
MSFHIIITVLYLRKGLIAKLMKQILYILILLPLFTNCKSQKQIFAYSSETLKIHAISKNTFTHISYLNTNDFGKVACNGLIYIDNNEAILFDTPTTPDNSTELIKWITEVKNCTITAIVINHFHQDCLGGLEAFHALGIPSYANHKTIVLSQNNNFIVPKIGFDNTLELSIGTKKVINHFFGEAHTQDNIVSYIPSEHILFGGCMIKSLNASKGFTGDANLEEWSKTVTKIKAKYPKVKIIIPGHGKSGAAELLDYTIQLFQ